MDTTVFYSALQDAGMLPLTTPGMMVSLACRWDVVSPQNSASGAWEMVLSAKCSISAGEPLALSYFDGSNDEFLLHYGFVPPTNPHDTVLLYPNLANGLEAAWWADVGSKVGGKR
jgi:hypothetical protein